jgi:hypothetical protein
MHPLAGQRVHKSSTVRTTSRMEKMPRAKSFPCSTIFHDPGTVRSPDVIDRVTQTT